MNWWTYRCECGSELKRNTLELLANNTKDPIWVCEKCGKQYKQHLEYFLMTDSSAHAVWGLRSLRKWRKL